MPSERTTFFLRLLVKTYNLIDTTNLQIIQHPRVEKT
jgi:hypothetical protein